MGVFCDRLKFGSKAALNCHTGQNKDKYCEKELSLLLVSLNPFIIPSKIFSMFSAKFIKTNSVMRASHHHQSAATEAGKPWL